MKKSNSGFTLIELIVVIVILGILAVTAAPKFIDLQSDARLATINGVRAALNSAVSLVHGKALVKNQDKELNGTVSINGTDVTTKYGYPKADLDSIQKVTDLDIALCSDTNNTTSEWCLATGDTTGGETSPSTVKIYIGNHARNNLPDIANNKCYVQYSDSYKTTTSSGTIYEVPKVELPSGGAEC